MELLPRVLLFVPGNREDRIRKAMELPCEGIILDLEDSVPYEEKGRAREIVSSYVRPDLWEGKFLFVRINHPDTGLLEDELSSVLREGLFGITIPKINSPEEIKLIDEKIKGFDVKLLPWVESPEGVMRTYEIGKASDKVVGIAFGADDYLLSTGGERSEDGLELLFPRAYMAMMARACGVMPYDTPYVNYRDTEGLKKETVLIKKLGFYGKMLIHPSQIEPVKEILKPSPEEVERARRIVEAYMDVMKRGSGVAVVDGIAVDRPIFERAKKIIGGEYVDKG